MSDQPVDSIHKRMGKLLSTCEDLGSPVHDPFMTMSFMALEVIPSLKLTDQGLINVEKFEPVSLFVEN